MANFAWAESVKSWRMRSLSAPAKRRAVVCLAICSGAARRLPSIEFSARASVFAFLERGFSVAIVNRTRERAEKLAAQFGPRVSVHNWRAVPKLLAEADVLINNTSLGMAGKPPMEIDLAPLKKSAIVYDVVYVPLETPLLKAAKAAGHRTVDGLSMLLYQAVNGFSHWFGVTPKVTAEQRRILEDDIRAKSR